MDEERKYPDINKLYKEAYDTAYMEASLRAAFPQKPVAWLLEGEAPFLIFPDEKLRRFKDYVGKPLYFATIRQWKGLSDEDHWEAFSLIDPPICEACKNTDTRPYGEAIEAKLKEKNA